MPSKRGYDKTVVELRQIARRRRIKYYYRMRKAELCKALGYAVPRNLEEAGLAPRTFGARGVGQSAGPSGVTYSSIKRDFYKLYAIKTTKPDEVYGMRYKTVKRAYYSKTNPAYWKDISKSEEAKCISLKGRT